MSIYLYLLFDYSSGICRCSQNKLKDERWLGWRPSTAAYPDVIVRGVGESKGCAYCIVHIAWVSASKPMEYLYIYVNIWIFMCIHIYIGTCMYIYMHICIDISIYIYK